MSSSAAPSGTAQQGSAVLGAPDVTSQRWKARLSLRSGLLEHSFKPYSREEIEILCKVIATFVHGREDYPDFDGLMWVFVRENAQTVDELVDWASSYPDQGIDNIALLSHWSSTDAPAHDSAGIFGFSHKSGENRLLALGAMLKKDMCATMSIPELAQEISQQDENRTGYTSALYMAYYSDALVLKVSAKDRSIKLFYRGGSLGGVSVDVNALPLELFDLLGKSMSSRSAHARPVASPANALLLHREQQATSPVTSLTDALLSLEDRILAALQQTGKPMDALEIAKAVGFEKQSDVNPILQKMIGKVRKEQQGQSRPLWSIDESSAASRSHAYPTRTAQDTLSPPAATPVASPSALRASVPPVAASVGPSPAPSAAPVVIRPAVAAPAVTPAAAPPVASSRDGSQFSSPTDATRPLEERIMLALRHAGKPLNTLAISKAVGLVTQSDVNPTLEILRKAGRVKKDGDGQSKPCWTPL